MDRPYIQSTNASITQFRIPTGVRRALAPFLLSRLLLILIFALVPLVAQVPTAQWGRDDSIVIKVNGHAVQEGLAHVALGNDAGWYLSIAQHGYEQRPFSATHQANWAFFPLHPLLWRAVAALTGEWLWSGVLLANVLTLAGWSMLWSLTHKLTNSNTMADNAVMFAAFWPSSHFMLLPQTEALFFACITFAFLAAYADRWWLAGIAGLLAGATRFNGLFLGPSLAARWLQGERKPGDLLKLLLIGAGLIAFMAHLWSITGNPFAFKDIQSAWGRTLVGPWKPLLDYVNHPLKVISPWNPKLLHFLIAILGLTSAITCWRQHWYGMAIFTAITILVPLSTGTLMSMTRYVGVAPGVYLALAVWSERDRRMGQLFLVVFAIAMTLLCVSFAAGINLGGA